MYFTVLKVYNNMLQLILHLSLKNKKESFMMYQQFMCIIIEWTYKYPSDFPLVGASML